MIEPNRHRYVGNSFWVRNDCHVNADRHFQVEAGVEDTRLLDTVRPYGVMQGSPMIESSIVGTCKDGSSDESAQMALRFRANQFRPLLSTDEVTVKQVAGKGGIKVAFTREGVELTTRGKSGQVKMLLPGTYSSKRYQLASSPNVTEVLCKRKYYDGNYIGFTLKCIDSSKPFDSKTYSFLWTGKADWTNEDGSLAPQPLAYRE